MCSVRRGVLWLSVGLFVRVLQLSTDWNEHDWMNSWNDLWSGLEKSEFSTLKFSKNGRNSVQYILLKIICLPTIIRWYYPFYSGVDRLERMYSMKNSACNIFGLCCIYSANNFCFNYIITALAINTCYLLNFSKSPKIDQISLCILEFTSKFNFFT